MTQGRTTPEHRADDALGSGTDLQSLSTLMSRFLEGFVDVPVSPTSSRRARMYDACRSHDGFSERGLFVLDPRGGSSGAKWCRQRRTRARTASSAPSTA
jgi:hypothetical protein